MGVKASACEGSDARENEFMQGELRARKLVYWRTAMGVINICLDQLVAVNRHATRVHLP